MPNEQKDIFDIIMHLPGLRLFEGFYKKYKEGLLYLFFGGLAFFLSVFLFWLFHVFYNINEHISNIVVWIIVVLFAFITNRTWVFRAKTDGIKDFFKQISAFYLGRIATLVVEEVILFIFITLLDFNSMIVKIIAQFIVIVLNYIISKLFVFKKN